MTTNDNKPQDPRTDQPTDDDTTGHAARSWRAGEMDHDDSTKHDKVDDDTEGHSGLGYHQSGTDDDAMGKSTIRPDDETTPGARSW